MYSSSVKVIFFDVGGVLLSNGWGHESRQLAAKQFNFNFDEFETLHNFIFNVYEIGKISLDEYLDITVFNQPRAFTREDFKSFMYASSVELPETLQWLVQWKQQHPQIKFASINNEGKELNNYRIAKFQLHKCYDAFISSCEVGMRKPDPGIFKLAMGIMQVQPEHCMYFDDRVILVQAAQRLGIQGHHHVGYESTRKIIESIEL
jgi:putative hydrolase of the HAD superfamily